MAFVLAPLAIEAGKFVATEVGKALSPKPKEKKGKAKTHSSDNPGPRKMLCVCVPVEGVTLMEAIAGDQGAK